MAKTRKPKPAGRPRGSSKYNKKAKCSVHGYILKTELIDGVRCPYCGRPCRGRAYGKADKWQFSEPKERFLTEEELMELLGLQADMVP